MSQPRNISFLTLSCRRTALGGFAHIDLRITDSQVNMCTIILRSPPPNLSTFAPSVEIVFQVVADVSCIHLDPVFCRDGRQHKRLRLRLPNSQTPTAEIKQKFGRNRGRRVGLVAHLISMNMGNYHYLGARCN